MDLIIYMPLILTTTCAERATIATTLWPMWKLSALSVNICLMWVRALLETALIANLVTSARQQVLKPQLIASVATIVLKVLVRPSLSARLVIPAQLMWVNNLPALGVRSLLVQVQLHAPLPTLVITFQHLNKLLKRRVMQATIARQAL